MEVANNSFSKSKISSDDHSLIFLIVPFCFTGLLLISKVFIQMHFECLKFGKYYHIQKEAFLLNQIPEMVSKTELLYIETLFIPVSSGFWSSSCNTNVNCMLSLPQLFEDQRVKKVFHYHYSIVTSTGSICLIVKWNKDYNGIKRHFCDNI